MQQDQIELSSRRVHQSVVRWPFQKIPLYEFCMAIADTGLEGIDVLLPEEYDVPSAMYNCERRR
jgi:hypothetical protein